MEDELRETLERQAKELASMRLITAEVFATLCIDEEVFLQSLRDERLHSPEEWASLQKHRSMLEKALEKKFQEAAKQRPRQKDLLIQPHWIHVR